MKAMKIPVIILHGPTSAGNSSIARALLDSAQLPTSDVTLDAFTELNVTSEAIWLQSLNSAERARFLASLSHNLTVATRVLCHSNSNANEVLEWVRLINEISHRVTSYLSHYHAGDEDHGWVSVVVEYVLSSQDATVYQHAQQAWSHTKYSFAGSSTA
jgi:ABC-type transport system involved in cytochrome bd biosynthesis fused ATPase/permease subunit